MFLNKNIHIKALFFLLLFFCNCRKNEIEPYPLVNSNLEKFNKFPIDDNGIVMLQTPDGNIYYPITIALIALSNYTKYVESSNIEYKNNFFIYSDWLINNFENNGDWGGWYIHHNLNHTSYNLPDKWLSAMSQGMGLSVMGIAYKETKNDIYLEIGEKVINSYQVPFSDGGFTLELNNKKAYLEYPTKSTKVVLNGLIFSLAGLKHYNQLTKNKKSLELFNNGVEYLKENLASYDVFFNSLYSSSNNPQVNHTIASATGAKYHHLHIAQLLWLYTVTKDIFFYDFAHSFLKKDFNDCEEYGLPNKFSKIEASKSIDEENYGSFHLNDGIWTYGKYWSTYKYPTSLQITFNRVVNKLDNLILVTTGSTIENDNIEILAFRKDNWQKIEKEIINEYFFEIPNFTSNVMQFNFAYPIDSISEVEILFKDHHTNSKVIALREINFTYDMHEELDFLIKKLNY